MIYLSVYHQSKMIAVGTAVSAVGPARFKAFWLGKSAAGGTLGGAEALWHVWMAPVWQCDFGRCL